MTVLTHQVHKQCPKKGGFVHASNPIGKQFDQSRFDLLIGHAAQPQPLQALDQVLVLRRPRGRSGPPGTDLFFGEGKIESARVEENRLAVDPAVPSPHFKTDCLQTFIKEWTLCGHIVDREWEGRADELVEPRS